jgi:hypothetical protein
MIAAAATVVARAYAPSALPAPFPGVSSATITTVDFYETDWGMVTLGRMHAYWDTELDAARAQASVQALLDDFERRIWYGGSPPKRNRWQRRQQRLARNSQ